MIHRMSLIILTFTLITALTAGVSFSAQPLTPAGTSISNSAVCTYQDETGKTYEQESNTVFLVVARFCSIGILPDGTPESPGQVHTAGAGDIVYIPYFLKNPGNSEDQYRLSVENMTDDSGDLAEIIIYIDEDADGIRDASEKVYDNADPPVLAIDETMALLVSGKVVLAASSKRNSPNALLNILINLKGTSLCDPDQTDSSNIAKLQSGSGFIALVKSADKTEITAGDDIRYTVDVSNPSSQAAKGVLVQIDKNNDGAAETYSGMLIYDRLAGFMTLIPLSVTYRPAPPKGQVLFAGQNGLWKTDAAHVDGKIIRIALFLEENSVGTAMEPGQTSSLEFTVTTDPNTTPFSFGNIVTSEYRNGTGDLKLVTESNNVKMIVMVLSSIVVDDTDDGGVHTGGGVSTDPDDLMEIMAADGQTVFDFQNEACNLGNTADTINLTVDPARSVNLDPGARVSFYSVSGKLLTDSNGDGIPDTGILSPGQCAVFITRLELPVSAVGTIIIAIKGSSAYNASLTDYTFNQAVFSEIGTISLMKSADKTVVQPGETVRFVITASNDRTGPIKAAPIAIDLKNTGRPDVVFGMLVYDSLPADTILTSSSLAYSSYRQAFPVYSGKDAVWKTDPSHVTGNITAAGVFFAADALGNAFDGNQTAAWELILRVKEAARPKLITNTAFVRFNSRDGEQTFESNAVPIEIPVVIRVTADDTDDNGDHTGAGVHTDPDDLMEAVRSDMNPEFVFLTEVCNFGNVDDSVNLTFNLEKSLNSVPGLSIRFTDLSGNPLTDSNGDGLPDVGTLKPGECYSFYSIAIVPPEALFTDDLFLAVQAVSSKDKNKTDLTFLKIIDDGFLKIEKSADKTQVKPGDQLTFTMNFSNFRSKPVQGAALEINGNPETGVLVHDNIPIHSELSLQSVSVFPKNGIVVYAGSDGIWKTSGSDISGRIEQVGVFFRQGADDAAFAARTEGSLTFSVHIHRFAPPGVYENIAVTDFKNTGGIKTTPSVPITFEILPNIEIIADDTDDELASTGSGVPSDPDDLMEITHTTTGVFLSFANEAWNMGNMTDIINLMMDPNTSSNIPAGVTVSFFDMTGTALPDSDGDGRPDTGPLAPGGRFPFITKIFIPDGVRSADVIAAVKGISKNDPSVTDLTFNQIGKIEGVLIQIMVKVPGENQGIKQLEWAQLVILKNTVVIVYVYNEAGVLVGQKKFLTDDSGLVRFDETGEPFPLYNWMQPGFTYRIGLETEQGGFAHYLIPPILLKDFDQVRRPGDTYTRGEIALSVLDNGTILLSAPLEPAGYVYDGVTGEKINGVCIGLYRCDSPACDTFTLVNEAGLDAYSDGKTGQENIQVSGVSRTGNDVNKGVGGFEFRWADFSSLNEGWYFISADYSCGFPGSNPDLGATYAPVLLNRDGVWEPKSGRPYLGEKFYLHSGYQGAISMRMPLKPADFRNLEITKTVTVKDASPGDFVKFAITVKNPNKNYTVQDIRLQDALPRELRYRKDSSFKDKVRFQNPEISGTGTDLVWEIGSLEPGQQTVVTFYTVVSGTASVGRKVNTAAAHGWTDRLHSIRIPSNTAYAWFDINKGEFTDKGFIIGKVFVDDNDNAVQDENEPGVGKVKIYMEDGRFVVTDSEGKYHLDDIEPGTHVLKVDPESLPRGSVLKPVNNRNLGDGGSAFADVFPGDIFKCNFRLSPQKLEPQISSDAQMIEGKVTVKRAITSALTDAASGKTSLKHEVVIANQSGYPLYALDYEETSPFIPSKGTVYLNGGSFVNPEISGGTFRWQMPLAHPHETLTITFLSDIPERSDDGSATLSFSIRPAADQKISLPARVPIVFASDVTGSYSLTVYFEFGEFSLTDASKKSLDTAADFLRKREFQKVNISVKGHTDSVRVRPERTDYRDNPELSVKRAQAVSAYLKTRLLDMQKVRFVHEDLKPAGTEPVQDSAATLDVPEVSIREQGFGDTVPAVPNTTLPTGTPENRRVEVKVFAVKAQGVQEELSFSSVFKRGLYEVRIGLENGYPAEELYDAVVYVKLPPDFNVMNGTVLMDGSPAEVRKKGSFISVSVPKLKAGESVRLSMKCIPIREMSISDIPCLILAKTKNGKTVSLLSRGASESDQSSAMEQYFAGQITPQIVNQSEVAALKAAVRYGITHPETDGIQTAKTGIAQLVLPVSASFRLTLNGAEVPASKIGETSTDDKLNVKTVKYIGLEYDQPENHLVLEWGDQTDQRTVTITGQVEDIQYSLYPEKPPADGKTPVYVTIQLKDRNGNLVKENAYLEVTVDKGDIYDSEKKAFQSYLTEKFMAKVVAGNAVVVLSPASATEERRLTSVFGTIEKSADIRFYPEKRPWIVVGTVEGGIGWNQTKNDPPETGAMPFDHHQKEVSYDGRTAVFGKGTVKDYTVTFRYDTKRPDERNALMKENTPATEDEHNKFYPVYGDDSEQYFEAPSREKLYLKAEKDLSYVLYGDYKTDFGKDMEFNKYSRTFNGGMLNLEKSKDYRINSFVTENSQSIVREDLDGRGVSGPYFLKNSAIVEFSERVYVQTLDRFNPELILHERMLNRYTDYTISYSDGWIIFSEPIPRVDEDLNPIRIRVIYETENLADKQVKAGVRGEKKFLNGNLTVGAMGILEEHPEKNRTLIGADIVYDNGKNLKIVGETTHSANADETDFSETSGIASRVEAAYKVGSQADVKAYYKKVNSGFQNLSSSNSETGYETYGIKAEVGINDQKTTLKAGAGVDNNAAVNRTKAEITAEQQVGKKFKVIGGARWNQEDTETEAETTVMATAGIGFQPTEKLGITIQRDQSLTGKTSSTVYPTKTSGKISYKLLTNLDAYVQTELQELAEKDTSVTTAGLDTKIGENTTAFSKYTIDDSVSGWRNQSHIGVNHQFRLTQNFTLDAGIENVQTLKGEDEKEDYTAPRTGFTYLQKDKYKLTGRAEARFGKEKDDYLFTLGGAVKLGQDYTILATGRYFDSDYTETNLLVGLAYRPVFKDNLNFLTKIRWKNRLQDELDETKYIGTIHANWQPIPDLTLMGEYAAKFAEIEELGHTFTDLFRARAIYDLTDRIDVGFHAGLLTQYDTNTYTLAYGPEIGFKVIENLWLSVGYNFSGFYDRDFDEANYWEQGPYVKIRLKFDEETIKKAFRKFSNKGEKDAE